jgi:hypothetical protein
MRQAVQLLAVFWATIFAGPALYISVVDRPAGMALNTRARCSGSELQVRHMDPGAAGSGQPRLRRSRVADGLGGRVAGRRTPRITHF